MNSASSVDSLKITFPLESVLTLRHAHVNDMPGDPLQVLEGMLLSDSDAVESLQGRA